MYSYDDNDHITENETSEQPAAGETTGNAAPVQSEPECQSAADSDYKDVYSLSKYSYSACDAPGMTKPKKEKRKHGFLRAVCLVLVCIIFSGITCYFVADEVVSKHAMETGENGPKQVMLGSSEKDNSKSSNDGTQVIYTGDELTSEQVYSLSCTQVVGVNTSVNTTNMFGQTTANAVSGSGFIISEDGYIMTNYHVISYAINYDGDLTVKLYDGTGYDAEIIGYNEDNDIAILKIDASGLTPVTLGSSDDMIVGETIYAVGNPLGELTYTMTSGIVSALDRIITTSDTATGASSSINMFQIDAAVNSGNSGGPVYNAKGEVIGIVTAKYSSSGVEGLGFAIPINDAMDIAKQLIERGYVTGAYLGVEVAAVTDVYSKFTIQYYGYPNGVYLMKVNPGSCADAAGLQVGDIITKIGDTEVTTTDALKLELKKYNPGDTGVLTVYRAGNTLGSGKYYELDIVFDESQPQAQEETEQQQAQQTPEDELSPQIPGYGIFPFGW